MRLNNKFEAILYEERQCRYNAILRHSNPFFLPWKSNKYYIIWLCVCSLSYPAYKAPAHHYIVISGLTGCTIFPALSQTRQGSRKKKVSGHKMCVLTSIISAWNISHSKRNWARYDQKCIFVFMYSVRYSTGFEWNLNFRHLKILRYQVS